jgi:threonine dehydrogenase-like Zn-dependent dehydrogenase
MKAVVWHGVGDIRVDDVPEPTVREPYDAIVRITTSAICGTDLHFVRGTMAGMKEGTVLGHEGVGIVEQVGPGVRNLEEGDRVVIPSTIGCGSCGYCRAGYFSQCDNANPGGPQAGTAFFGGPESSGPFDGMQAEKVRVPFANVGLIKLPDDVDDDAAIMLSDIFPTAYYGADMAEITPGDIVAVYGAGPVGQFAIWSAFKMGAGRVLVVDRVPDRLAQAKREGAEIVNFDEEDPTEAIMELTRGTGADRVIDAVGVDAEGPQPRPEEVAEVAPEQNPQGEVFKPGQAPSQASEWAVRTVAKAGTISIVGVYSPTAQRYPIGEAMNRNLTIKMGNCPHRRYIPTLLGYVASGEVDPSAILTVETAATDAVEAYRQFDQRRPGWLKVALEPAA